jgi:hypothetical protein
LKIFDKIFFLFFIFSIPVWGQLGHDSLNYSLQNFNDRLLTNNFEKQLNTYNLNTLVKYSLTSDKIFFGIRENFNSTVTKSTIVNIKDEQYLWAFGQYNFSEMLKFGLLFNNSFYTDDRQLAINKASLMNTSVFAKYQPLKNMEITPFGGLSQNNQIGELDNGFIYGGEANIDKLNIGDFDLSSLMKFQNEDISPRKNTLRLINLDINSLFEENFSNTISVYYTQQRKDFYFIADTITAKEYNITNNIQSRTESNYYLQDRIKYAQPNSPFSIDMQGRITWRDIDRNTQFISLTNVANTNYDTRIQEFKVDFSSAADYITEYFNLSFRFSFAERDEKHQPKQADALNSIILNERESLEQQKNNNSQLANISLLGRINLSNRDHLTFSIFHRKLQYDTPSDLNYDDRDELLSIGRVMYEKEFNPFFKVFANLEANLNKVVYIFAERSSNNNTKRILKFSSGGTFSTGIFTSSNSAEVSSNYTVYDYEQLYSTSMSYSFRQFVFRDSSNYKLTKTLKLFFAGYIKLSEQGNFSWSDFSSKPQRYLSEQYAEPKIFYELRSLSLGLGVRFFSLSTFGYTTGMEKNLLSDYTSVGPLTEISYLVGERINLKIYGYYEFIKSEDNTKREMANLSIKLNYKL